MGQAHDALHVVIHRLDETGAALRIFILRAGALGLVRLAIVKPIAAPGIFPDAILMIQSHVEPDGRIEGAILVHTQPGQIIAEYFPVGLRKVPVLHAPIRDRPANALDELAHRGFAFGCVLFAIEIF